jgi:hypothetical protein
MDKWPLCWWDTTGQPIAAPAFPQLTGAWLEPTLHLCVRVRGESGEWKLQSPTGDVGDVPTEKFSQIRPNFYTEESVTVGVAVGPWKKVGTISKGGQIVVGSATYRLTDGSNSSSDGFSMRFAADGPVREPDWVALSAVTNDGNEVGSMNSGVISNKRGLMSDPTFRQIAKDQVKIFNVWVRKREWVTFSAMVNQPEVLPEGGSGAASKPEALSPLDSGAPQ